MRLPHRSHRKALLLWGVVLVTGITGGATAASAILSGHRSVMAPPTVAGTALPTFAVFERAQTPAEAAAAQNSSIASIISSLTAPAAVQSDWLPGSGQAQSVRVPLMHVGRYDRSVFIFRTTKNRVCAGVTDFSAGCLTVFPADQPMTVEPGAGYNDEGPIVWGLVRDGVRSVSVRANGTQYPAQVRGNMYYFQGPVATDTPDALQSVTATTADGQTYTAAINVPATHPQPPAGG